MRAARLMVFVPALLVAAIGGVATAAAQASAPGAAKAPPIGDIAFYVARGDADACGPGCSEWIAADGQIDAGAAQRLRRLLAKLGRRRLAVFFDSRGGSLLGSIELGRFIREQKLTTGVARTIPHGCDRDKMRDKACEALKRSGQELAADFNPNGVICASGCVLAVAGGSTRPLLPGVKLGIHDVGIHPAKGPLRGAALAEAERAAHARIQDFLRDMGIDTSLLAAASAVPNASVRYLKRDEIAGFGIDRREFGEDVWRFADKPSIELSKRFFFDANTSGERRYRDGGLFFKCGIGANLDLALVQDRSDQKFLELSPARIDVKGQRIYLDPLIASATSEMRTGSVPADMLDSIAGDETALISGIKVGGENGPAGDIALKMAGFAASYAKLKQSCGTAERAALPSPPPTPPQKYELVRTAIATQRLRLDAIVPVCQMGPMSVSVLEQPQHGALTIENGQIDPCRPIDAVVLYEPSAGYAGPDSITLNVAYPFGTVATRHYSIEVTAPAGPAAGGEPISPR